MEVIGTKCCVTFRTFTLSSFISSSDALSAEHVETLGEYSVLLSATTAGTVQLCLLVRSHY